MTDNVTQIGDWLMSLTNATTEMVFRSQPSPQVATLSPPTYQSGWSIESQACQMEAVCFCLGPQLGWAESHWGDSPYAGRRKKHTHGAQGGNMLLFVKMRREKKHLWLCLQHDLNTWFEMKKKCLRQCFFHTELHHRSFPITDLIEKKNHIQPPVCSLLLF